MSKRPFQLAHVSATSITAYLEYGAAFEVEQAIAAYESPWTTNLYDRTSGELTLESNLGRSGS